VERILNLPDKNLNKVKKLQPPSYIYVSIQLILFVLYFIPLIDYGFHLPAFVKTGAVIAGIAGVLMIALAIIQLDKNITPFPAPVEGGSLIQTGLYRFIRHPIYSGIILAALGFGIASSSAWKTGIGIALWVLFYFKSRYEESLLLKKFPEYERYRNMTGRFFPFI
jgi:protein-S-isoprenylcysteine O-methyltransferase Ste14